MSGYREREDQRGYRNPSDRSRSRERGRERDVKVKPERPQLAPAYAPGLAPASILPPQIVAAVPLASGPAGVWGTGDAAPDEDAPAAGAPALPAEKANFGLSGALARDSGTGNVIRGVALKWSEPPEARVPDRKFRFFVFKGADSAPVDTLHIHRLSAYLVGRDRDVVDILIDHASASKQHAVIQFRLVPLPQEPGDMGPPRHQIKPYVMDLESTNGTRLNGVRLEPARYVELRESDVLRFGDSTREYVLMVAT